MLELFSHGDGAQLRSVKLRSANRDALQIRQRLERALANVEWRPCSLPPRAMLMVRRLAPNTRGGQALDDCVTQALDQSAREARRPWVHDDARVAQAVWFVDEAELAACLVRDWLHARVADRWWWRSVLGGLSPPEWLRRHVLARGEVMVPALAILADTQDAVAWLSQLDDASVEVATAAVMRSYALAHALSANHVSHSPRERRRREDAALERLFAAVPEVCATVLRPPQRRLLALTLVLVRVPFWARTAQLALALQALDRAASSQGLAPQALDRTASSRAPATALPASRRVKNLSVVRATTAAVVQSVTDKPMRRQVQSPGPASADLPARAEYEESPVTKSLRPGVPTVRAPGTPGGLPAASAHEAVEGSTSGGDIVPAAAVPIRASPKTFSVAQAERVHTSFGGTFYLLNAALALNLYADFTSPRGRNLRISPWDWLALIGRAWFGREFVRDPVWKLLAELAGRERRYVRRPRWLKAQIETLLARLVLAIGEERSADIPTFVCRHRGEIVASDSRVDVYLALADLPIALRIAGLDRDPGWIPAAGRSIAFHFE